MSKVTLDQMPPSKEVSSDVPENKDLANQAYPVTDLESSIVGWDAPDDPRHPRSFPPWRKWMILGLVSITTFLSSLASSINAPGITVMDTEFHNDSATLAFRFLAGLGGSACLTIGGGIVADLFPIAERGRANAMFAFGSLFGPVLGPIAGGFIAQRAGWRWAYWVLLCACVTVTTANIVLSAETNTIILIRRKAEKLRKELYRPELQCVYDIGRDPHQNTKRATLARGIIRPLRLVFGSVILSLLAVYVSFIFSLLYLLFTTLTSLYKNVYHWPVELCGLAYLGLGFGFMTGLFVVAKTSDATIIRLTRANNNVYEPEMRLASCLLFALFVPISFFWYGWAADQHAHWIIPLIGLAPFAFGLMGILLPIQTYFIDVGGKYAASAVAGQVTLRCLFGAFLPLAGPSMYASLGLGWGNSLLGFLALCLIPVPALIFKYGASIRRKYPVILD
ncbi:hypothetical protein BBP40_006995 [Aspergillus hancockii]|nr:hypothetical protein BBP40_006995 [Aspergillus hancockii]